MKQKFLLVKFIISRKKRWMPNYENSPILRNGWMIFEKLIWVDYCDFHTLILLNFKKYSLLEK
tara:strand:- start:3048 stop:3236 length:189 start_codon:yes stop_codon:yes gene_type:complete